MLDEIISGHTGLITINSQQIVHSNLIAVHCFQLPGRSIYLCIYFPDIKCCTQVEVCSLSEHHVLEDCYMLQGDQFKIDNLFYVQKKYPLFLSDKDFSVACLFSPNCFGSRNLD